MKLSGVPGMGPLWERDGCLRRCEASAEVDDKNLKNDTHRIDFFLISISF